MPHGRLPLALLAAAAVLSGCASAAAAPVTPVRPLALGPTAGPATAPLAPEPTPEPTPVPTAVPTAVPTPLPTRAPAPRPTPAPTPRPTAEPLGPIVALGDSLTYGYGAGVTMDPYGPAPALSYPWDMARDLGIPVVNAGIVGTSAHEVLDVSSETEPRPLNLQLPALLALHPRLMVVGFGTNEANRGWPIPRAVSDLGQLLGIIAAAHVPIVLVGTHVDCTVEPCQTAAGSSPQTYTIAWDAALTTLAAEYHAGLVLDVEQGFAAADMSDWIHCTAQGYQLMADRIEAVVRTRLG